MIDWHKQWESHARYFSQGLCRFPIKELNKHVLLKPGPGFGDLSHPTTRVVIELLKKEKNDAEILDIGCGSGILSLVAKAYEAPFVYGIDIDPLALEHANENASLNKMDISFKTAEQYLKLQRKPKLILFNMIRSEQKQAWSALFPIHHLNFKVIASGVMKEEKERYLMECKERKWQLVDEQEKEGWLGLVFKNCYKDLS